MKKALFIFGLAGFHAAGAQSPGIFNAEDYLKKKSKASNLHSYITTSPFINQNINNPLTTGSSIIILPTDNMPCLKPDMSQFTLMPNAAGNTNQLMALLNDNTRPGNIPNVAPPKREYYLGK